MSSEYERKLVDMQYQMRENNAYLNDYMKDLNVWTDEIKKKEQHLQADSSSTAKDLPPIRNFVEPAKPKRKSKKKDRPSKAPSTIRAYDYRSWDQYDVDAECQRLDTETGQAESDESGNDESEEDNEQWQEEVLRKKAEYHKECGNYQFKQKSYSEAIEHYTKAIECNPMSAVYFANRAQCQLFEQRFGACEADGTLAIQLDGNFLKAYYRRALARIELKKLDQARQDLEYILSREPANREAREKLDEVNKTDEIKRLGRVYPLQDKPIDKRSTKPLKRIEIQEIDTSMITASSAPVKKKTPVIEEIVTTSPTAQPQTLPPPEPTARPQPQKSTPAEKQPLKPATIPTSVPTTGFQFKRDWANLTSQPEQQAIYFERIPPKSYKAIFSTGLDSSVVSRILLLWSNRSAVDEHLIDSMLELRQTPRFETQLSFLDSHDRQVLRGILQRLETECATAANVQSILRDYKID